MFALALAVGLTPELLPMIVTVTLAHGATRLARRGVVVKRLPAIHNLGAMDVLCTRGPASVPSRRRHDPGRRDPRLGHRPARPHR